MSPMLSDTYLPYLIIFFAGIAAYIISTLSGGGGSLLLVPVINYLIGGKATAPVINLGNLATALLTISFQAVKAAMANPVNSLRSE